MIDKNILLVISLLFCILFTISSVYAQDIDMNDTILCDDDYKVIEAINENECNESTIAYTDNDELLGDSTIYFDASASTDGDGSKSKPYKVFKWNRISSKSTVYFANGEYTLDNKKSLYSSFQSLKFVGQSKENTIFTSNFDNGNEITVFDNVKFTVSDMTLNGFHLYNSYGTIEATNVIFQNEIQTGSGGAIYSYGSAGSMAELKLTSCQFKNNAVGTNGGAISASNSNLIIDNCIFYNSSSSKYGGAIYSSNSNLTITNSVFNYNNALYGGALYVVKGKLDLKRSRFISSAAQYYGGAIVAELSDTNIESSNFTDSESIGDAGGAIYSLSCSLKVLSSQFTGGKSLFGGAICCLNTSSNIQSSAFTNNFATFYGGSIYDGYGYINITRNNFKASKADISGGSIYSSLTYSMNLLNNDFRNSSAGIGNAVSIDPVMQNKFAGSGNKYEGTSFDLQNSGGICFYNTNPYYEFDNDYSVPLFSYTPNFIAELPSAYDSRDYGYMTPVKDQGKGGNCWAFATIATLEACIKKATGITYDFSEENLKNLMAYYSLYGRDLAVNEGGYMPMAMGYLMGWFGPIYDELEEYVEFSALSANYIPLLHIQNVYQIPNNNRDLIKKAIVDYGAVSAEFSKWGSSAHAVTLVGWDDNYNGYDYFKDYAEGAWIFKNSWGEDWYDHGYFYVSFDRYIQQAYTFIFNDEIGYTDIYQYDLAGPTYYTINNYNAFKTRFTSRSNEILSAVAACFDRETDFTVTVYKNGNQVATQSGHSLAGYMTIPLKNEIPLKKDDEFIVEFQIKNSNARIRTSHYSTFHNPDLSHINVVTFKKGDSFAKLNGNWIDLYGSEGSNHVTACIKAYTRPAKLNEIAMTMPNQFSQVRLNDNVNVVFNVPDNIVGFVEFSINNQKYYAKIDNGRACLNISFDKEGIYNFKAQYKSNREISNAISFSFEVVKEIIIPNITISAPNVYKYFGGSQKYVATVYDNGVLQKDVYVDITIDGKTRRIKTNSYGQAILDLNDLKIGSYMVTAKYNSIMHTSKVTIKSTISAGDKNGTYLNTTVDANFLDSNGNALNSGQAIFEVGGKVFKANVNNGLAVADIDLGVGKYNVIIKNPNTNEEMEVDLQIEKAEQEITVLINQEGKNIIFDITVDKGVQDGYFYLHIPKFDAIRDNYVNGKIILTFNNLTVGSHSYVLYISGNENYTSIYEFFYPEFVVTDENIELAADDLTVYYEGEFYATLTYNGEPFEGEYISFEINGKIYEAKYYFSMPVDDYIKTLRYKTNDEGKAHVRIKEEPGVYPITVRYGNIAITENVTVKSTINCTAEDYDSSTSTISATFMYSDGVPFYKRQVTFVVNNVSYVAKTNDVGVATLKLDLNSGENTIIINNPVTGENKTINITHTKSTPEISLSKVINGNDVELTASLNPSDATGYVEFVVSGHKHLYTVKNGIATLTLKDLNPKSYNVSVQYTGDGKYNAVTTSISFTISKTTPTMTLQLTTRDGMDALMAKLSDIAATGTITFTTGGKDYIVDVVNGVSYLKFSSSGKYSIVVKYSGDGNFNSVSQSMVVTIADKNPKFIFNGLTKYYLDSKKFSVRLVDYNGKPLSSKVIRFEIDDGYYYSDEFERKTDSNGYVKLNFNKEPGTYDVHMWYGDVYDLAKVIVKKSKSIIKASKKTFKAKTKTKKYTVSLEIKGYYLTHEKVTLKVGGKTYKATTNSKGKATFKIKSLKKKGTYRATVTYKGDECYSKATKKVKIRVK